MGILDWKEEQSQKELDKTRPRKQTLAEKYGAENKSKFSFPTRETHESVSYSIPKKDPVDQGFSFPTKDTHVNGSYSMSRKDLVDPGLDARPFDGTKFSKIDDVPVRKKKPKTTPKKQSLKAKIKRWLKK